MEYQTQFVDLQGRPAAVVRGRVSPEGIADFLGPAFGEVLTVLDKQGLHPTGAPFGRYRPADDGGWEVEAGFPTSAVVDLQGRVEPSLLPGGRAARTMHVGSYADVGAAYKAALSWLTDEGHVVDGEPWECYLDEPEVAEPRTEVFVPCVAARPVPTSKAAGC